MMITDADWTRISILGRAILVWFFTILIGVGWMALEADNYPEEFGEWAMLFFQFGAILLFTLPVLYLTTILLRISSKVAGKAKKALCLLSLSILGNLIVYLPFLILMPFSLYVLFYYLSPFNIASVIMAFLVNIDWFILKQNGRDSR